MKSNSKNHMNVKEEIPMKKINQSQAEVSSLRNAIKRGVYKELHKKQMLTTQQLNELLAQTK